MMHLDVRDEIGPARLTVARREGNHQLTIDGESVPVTVFSAAPGEVDLVLDGRRCRAWVARHGDDRLVFLEGRTWTVHIGVEEAEAAEADGAAGPRLVASVPGRVTRILAAAGETVRRGQPLLILEAMKMETEVTAPMDGVVAVLRVAEGQTVALGDPLLEIEPAGEE